MTKLTLVKPDDEFVTAPQIAQLTGLTYRQLDYWTRTGLLSAVFLDDHAGSGHPRAYDQTQLRRARVIRDLLAAGMSLQVIREHLDDLLTAGKVRAGAITIYLEDAEND